MTKPELVTGSFVSKRDEEGEPVEFGHYAYMASPATIWDEALIRWAENRERNSA
jgi:hypothetical protein